MTAVVDSKIPRYAEETLIKLGHRTVKLPPHPTLPPPVSSHPDMLLFFSPNAIFCTESYAKIAKKELKEIESATNKPIQILQKDYGSTYPHDILLNVASVGMRLFCLPSHTAAEILALSMHRICAVRQGYAKCSTVPIGDKALITEDASIAKVARSEGLDVLQVEPYSVSLMGYDTGFLGGACSFAPYDSGLRKLLFCGDPKHHKNAEEILRFLEKHAVEPIALSPAPLTDVGTIFII
ncbi:MAG: hypothetical protein IJF33_05865 [Clostridia bacterium]|nr:hypothetical protein [Clostridia bacterium]